MGNTTRSEMDAVEIADFLDSRSTGTLSLANESDAYAIPVSFDYDVDTRSVYLRLGFGPNSQKRRFLDGTDHVSFVVYDRTDEGWKSVVVEGTTEELSGTALGSAIAESLEDLDIPYVRAHDRSGEQLEFSIVRIDPTSLTGIVAGH